MPVAIGSSAEVGRHRLIERQHAEAALVDLDVQLVDRLVSTDDPFGHLQITRHQSLDGGAHALFREPAHLQQLDLERAKLLLEMPYGSIHQPNLPVT